LQHELLRENLDDRKKRALRVVNANAARLLPGLDSERPNDPVSLDTDDLTVKITSIRREDYLSEIGSGSNWLSYHLAILLGLHQFFLTLDHSPVPGLLVLDQPSQVYFPKRLVVRETEAIEEPHFRDEDVEAVRKAYEVMARVVEAAKGKLQVIVLDHAARDVWGSIPSIVHFEEWREGLKLIPSGWISKPDSDSAAGDL
jgi:hypothetical protein